MIRPCILLGLVLLLSSIGSPTLAQDKGEPAAKPQSGESEASKARRDRIAAEVKKANAQNASKEPEGTETKIQLLALSGHYVDFNEAMGIDPTSLLFGSIPVKQKSFFRLCEFVDDLSKKSDVPWIVFDLSDSQLILNSAQLEELARRLTRLRATGKRLIGWLENASSPHLAIAASCDEVIMADFGGVDFPSASMQSLFYREAMDLFGIKASVVRAGDFKGAVEPYTNAQMSGHLRQHYVEMLESINDARVSTIAKGRGLTVAAVREIQSKRFLLPQEALASGLIDKLAPYGSMKETVERIVKEPAQWVGQDKKSEKEMSFFELMSKLMSEPNKGAGRARESSIAVLHLSGPLIDGKDPSPGLIVDGPTVKSIESLIDDQKIHGVVVRINSPGGSATASESIRQALIKLSEKKPTVISMGEMAASGGYWVSCIGVPVFAEQSTITGSIGVFSLKLSFGTLLRRIGVHLETIALDSSAAALSPDRPWSEMDEAVLQKTIDDVYGRFLKLVSKSRGMAIDKVEPLAGGRVWSGSQAKAHGLVDEIGGLDEAIAMVARKAKIDRYKTLHRPEPATGLDFFQLFGESDEDEIFHRLFSQQAIEIVRRSGFTMGPLRLLLKDAALLGQVRPTVWALHPEELKVR